MVVIFRFVFHTGVLLHDTPIVFFRVPAYHLVLKNALGRNASDPRKGKNLYMKANSYYYT